MKITIILFAFVIIASVSAVPLGPGQVVVDEEGNLFYSGLVPLERVRRQSGDFIKAGAVHSSKYGGGGQILVNKNLASSKHHSIDAQTKYTQYGNRREGWAGVNYSLRW